MSSHKTRREKTVKHSVFAECARNEKMSFWKVFFESCSVGTFQKYLSYKDNILYYKRIRRKPAITCFIPNDWETATDIIKEFMRKEIGVISVDELTKKRIEMNIALRHNMLPVDTMWKDIRAPTTRQQMLALYVCKMMQELNMSIVETNDLFITINVGLINGTLTGDDIILDKGTIVKVMRIIRIDGRFYTEEKSHEVVIRIKKTPQKHNQIYISHDWGKMSEKYNTYLGVK